MKANNIMNTSDKHNLLRSSVFAFGLLTLVLILPITANAQQFEAESVLGTVYGDTQHEANKLAECLEITQSFEACGRIPNEDVVCHDGRYLLDGGEIYTPKCIEPIEVTQDAELRAQYYYVLERNLEESK